MGRIVREKRFWGESPRRQAGVFPREPDERAVAGI
jgi:hypothetical protein